MLKKHIEMKTINEDFILQLWQHFIPGGNRRNRKKAASKQIETALQIYLSKKILFNAYQYTCFPFITNFKKIDQISVLAAGNAIIYRLNLSFLHISLEHSFHFLAKNIIQFKGSFA